MSVDERRQRVERGLSAVLQVAGRTVEHHSLAARMDRYRVPGAAVAVVDDGELSWASTGWSSVEAEVVLATRASLNRALEAAWTQMVIDLVDGRSRSAFSALERGKEPRDGADDPPPSGNAGAAPALGHGGDSP